MDLPGDRMALRLVPSPFSTAQRTSGYLLVVRLCWVFFAMLIALPASAAPSKSEIALAREKFQAGNIAAQSERWEEAHAQFAAAYALYPRPVGLFNLAGAQVKTGRLVAGIASYRSLLARREGLDGEQLAYARSEIKANEARVAYLVLHGPAECTVLLDEHPVADGARTAVDPTPHHVGISCAGTVVDARDVTLSDGETRTVSLRAPTPDAPALAPAPEPRRAPPSAKPASFVRPLGIVAAGTSVASFGVAAWLGVAGTNELRGYEDGCAQTSSCSTREVTDTRTKLTISDIALVSGIVLGLGAIYCLVVYPRTAATTPTSLAFLF